MRKAIRAALAGGAERVAVVCGAWHAPALVPDAFPSAAADNARLRGLPKVKVAATWVPWTSALSPGLRATAPASTPPAGTSTCPPRPATPPTRFLVEGRPAAAGPGPRRRPAATVEAVRLAEGLAALRGRPGPGLGEVIDAAQAVAAGGSPVPLRLVAPRAPRRRRPRLRARRHADGPPGPRPGRRPSAACGSRPRPPPSTSSSTCATTPTGSAPSCCTASPPRHRLGRAGRHRPHPGHVQGGVGAGVAAGASRSRSSRRRRRARPSRRRPPPPSPTPAAGRPTRRARRSWSRRRCWPNCPAALDARHRHAGRAGGAAARHRPAHGRGGAAGPHPPLRQRPPGRHRGRRSRPGRARSPVSRWACRRRWPPSTTTAPPSVRELVESVDRAVGLCSTIADPAPAVAGRPAGRGRPARRARPAGRAGGADPARQRRPRRRRRAAPPVPGPVAGRRRRRTARPGSRGSWPATPACCSTTTTLLRVVDDWVSEVRGAVFDDLLPLLRRTFAAFAAPDRRALGDAPAPAGARRPARPPPTRRSTRNGRPGSLPRLRRAAGSRPVNEVG